MNGSYIYRNYELILCSGTDSRARDFKQERRSPFLKAAFQLSSKLIWMQLHEKYKDNFDDSSEGSSSGSLRHRRSWVEIHTDYVVVYSLGS